ncbi:MAG: glycosyltransferase family 2 protein, partial [Planctomycetes bacterium]|nr:glycosyltransferase family 2 protein [Planctomycetota bacterium]
ELADFAPYSSLGAEELLGPARAARAAGDAAALHAALRAAVAATEIDRRTPYVVFQRQRAKEIPSREEAERAVASWGEAPLISILFPVYNCPEEYLDAALRSVRAQVYPRWQLCVADDASTHPHVRRVLERHAHEEPRVEIAWRRENGNISAASNTALEMARGEYAALLDNDDLLEPDALLEMARAARAHADTDMLYSDEDKIDEAGRRYLPFFKPDWSPDYFLSCMYTCHLAMFRTGLVREVGGFRSRYDGAQDWDLALRVSRRARRVVHVPRVLYHWRAHPGSMARDIDGKPYSHFAAQDALKDFLAGGAHPGRVDNGPLPCMFHVRYEIAGSPLVSIVVPTAGAARAVRGKPVCLVANLVARLLNVTAYQRYEVIIVATAALSAETRAALADERVRVIDAREPSFNFARAVNRGAAEARGDHLLFLNDDTEPINGDWLGGMLEFSQQPAVGAVGAKLLFESGALQHAGVTLQNGLPGHPFRGAPASAPGHFNSIVAPRNYSAVTGACLMTRRDLFNRLGGFDEGFPLNYNDIDYCLKARAAGLRVVYTPYATLYHFEGQSRAEQSPADWERGLFLSRWGQQYLVDPFFNPNLDPRFGDFRMRI